MHPHLILNPYANRWRVAKLRPAIERCLRATGIDYDLHVTGGKGEAIAFARQAAEEGAPLVIAAGGDGTIGEVINGLCAVAGAHTRLGIVPVGSGNDLAAMLGIPLDLDGACRALAAGRARPLDVGVAIWENGSERGTYLFGNNSGLGLEAAVAMRNLRLMHLTARLRYIVAVVQEIAHARQWQVELEWDGGHYRGPAVLLSVGNTRRNAGSFYLNPNAEPDDGLLDFIYGSVPSRLRLLQLLPLALRGLHIREPEIRMGRAAWLRVRCDPPTAVQTDGEVLSTEANVVEYRVLPHRLEVNT